jgi:hypothetical protein
MASQSVTCDTSEPSETVLLPAQGEIKIGWNEDGDMILRQSDWPNDDAIIVIARDLKKDPHLAPLTATPCPAPLRKTRNVLKSALFWPKPLIISTNLDVAGSVWPRLVG